MKRRTILGWIGLAALGVLGLSTYGIIDRQGLDQFLTFGKEPARIPSSRSSGRAGGFRDNAIPVLAEPVRTANVPVYLDGVGTVRAYKTVTVRAQVSGRLVGVHFKEGQDVSKGDILASIDPATYKAALDQVVAKKAMDEALLENARRDLERYIGLARSDYASKQQADTQRAAVAQAEAQVRQDQAAIDNAQANFNYTTITAPIDGRVGIRQVDEGNLVSSGDANGIVVITQLRPISVLFTLPERMVSAVATAKWPLSVTASVGSQELDAGILDVIDNQIDQATGTVKMKGTFENAQSRLWPGQFVNVRLLLKTLDEAMVVPASAIQQGTAGSYVYTIQNDMAKLTPVRVTQQNETQAVVATGLAPGQLIVTSGFANLRDGAKVSLSMRQPEAIGEPSTRESAPRRRRNASAADPPQVP